jgi:phosphinothricin acetyltransferase
MTDITIRPMTKADWPDVARVFREGIDTGHATFETDVPAWEDWDRSHMQSCRLVADLDGAVVAWAALTPVSDRCVYGGVAETSVYVGSAGRGRGLGTRLLGATVAASEEAGLWSLEAQTFPENAASIALHKKCGFREVGTRWRVGKMHHGPMTGAWRDIVLLQRRSETVGV